MPSIIFKKINPNITEKHKKEGFSATDMHFHTNYSMDAISHVDNVLRKAKNLGISLAITDHNQIGGSLDAVKKAKKKGVMVIPGIEATCREGVHSLYYFYYASELKEWYEKELKPRMKHNPFFASISTAELMENSKKYNCVIGAPHPYAPGITGMMKINITKKMEKAIKLIEVMNGFNLRKLNQKAVNWEAKAEKGITGGTDGHTTAELGGVLTFAQGTNVEDYLQSLIRRKSVVIGNEESIFQKAILSVIKEETYIKRAKAHDEAMLLIESQYKTEAKYMKHKIKKEEHELSHLFKIHHW